ncbi:MAG TPA: pyridine nucleotide-disulfide oxidoreductase, partial [Candidatus Polarisedimenticolia bacterium]|nr:pyridine nucleotide-disulfide oxidoreductase [Candidatus Polarisedimenticolia bacterium]
MSYTSGEPHRVVRGGALAERRDFALGLPGFAYADLHDPRRLADLTLEFDRALQAADPTLFASFDAYRRDPKSLGPVDRSNLLIGVGRHVGRFIGMLFRIETELAHAAEAVRAQDPIFVFKRDFLQRRAFKKYGPGRRPAEDFPSLDGRVRVLRRALFPELEFGTDPELATARMVAEFLALESHLTAVVRLKREPAVAPGVAVRMDGIRSRVQAAASLLTADLEPGAAGDLALVERILSLLVDWSVARLADPAGKEEIRSWVSYHTPEDLDYQHLVRVERPLADLPETMVGPADRRRRRDGFKLTDRRMHPREVLDQTHYCVLCHDRDKDSCSKGLPAREGGVKTNPLGIVLNGCPLDEKISEAHALKRQGDSLSALAVICLDNPMCPGTGHRICNDCMKACIYQKQEPVNIPQIETGVLTDVLALPYGFEIWSLLTRWNPLNVSRPHALPYNGKNVLVVGLGPAGYTLAHHLMNEGFGVVAIDGLKIEPLP